MNNLISKLTAILLLLAAQHAAAADIYAIVIGIDAYNHYGTLDGAVNDAKILADSLDKIGAKQIKLLLDEKATRNEIQKAWNEVSTQAKPGDTVFFTYAGHGAQQSERVKGTEADGQDEFYVLADFDVSGQSNSERIMDDDLQEWFSKRPDLNVILVSDSCHSGTMTRSYKKQKLKYRKIHIRAITDDTLPVSNSPDIVDERKTKLSHVVSFSGVPDNEEVPEVTIEGQQHGALSWYFSKGLLGSADSNKDGVVSFSELKDYLIEKVRLATEGQQHPQVLFVNDMPLINNLNRHPNTITFSVSNNPDNSPLVKSVLDKLKGIHPLNNGRGDLDWDTSVRAIKDHSNNIAYSFPAETTTKAYKRMDQPASEEDSQELVKLIQPVIDGFLAKNDVDKINLEDESKPIPFSISNNANIETLSKTVSDKLSGIQLVELNKGILEWDINAGIIRNQFSDVVYNFPKVDAKTKPLQEKGQDQSTISPETIERLQVVINKHRLVEKLKTLADGSLGIKPDDKLHAKGDSVIFEVDRLKYPYFTLINLAVDGTINFLYPSDAKDSLTIPIDKPYKLGLDVSEPFGADHFIAIVSDKPLSELHETLKKLNNTSGSLDGLKKALNTALKGMSYQVGIQGSFTTNSLDSL